MVTIAFVEVEIEYLCDHVPMMSSAPVKVYAFALH